MGNSMSSRILITGAQGFLGRYLVADWLSADPDISIAGLGRSVRCERHFTHVVNRRGTRVPAPLPMSLAEAFHTERYKYHRLDLADTKLLASFIQAFRPDIVIHLAASLRDDPPDCLGRNNIGAVVSLLQAIRESGLSTPRVVFGSSGSVYGRAIEGARPLHEDSICTPIDPYSVTKQAAEKLGRILADNYEVQAMWARIFNPVGPGQDERHLCGWLGCQVAAIADGIEPPVVTAGALETTRDYIDARDVATAIRLIATKGVAGWTYNVANGQETSGEQILETLLGIVEHRGRVSVERRQGRPVDILRHFADVGRLAALGYQPKHSLRESLADVLDYYRELNRDSDLATT
jgi:nucleoside-diphosphate-sugar epimerase